MSSNVTEKVATFDSIMDDGPNVTNLLGADDKDLPRALTALTI